ncbi:MAG: hypothetical protein HZA52_06505 [Planctomycetes bacterium]|nr:hypothetical protein [Planctomycetota bacterium]
MKHLVLALVLAAPLAACRVSARAVPVEPCEAQHTEHAFGFDVVPLQFASADELAGILGRTTLSAPPTRVIADHRTNSLIIQGPDEGRAAARVLIEKLDIDPAR